MVSSKTIIDRASKLLLDETNVRWSTTELLDWLNSAQNEAVILKPDCHVTVVEYKLVAGTKQRLPDGTSDYKDSDDSTVDAGIVLIDLIRNMGTDGETPGRAIQIVDREIMDSMNPDWHGDTASDQVLYYMFNNDAPKVFYIYPAQPDADQGYIEAEYSSRPTPVSSYAADQYIDLDDVYENVLLDYILYRGFAKDNSQESNAKAAAYYGQFRAALSGKDQMEEVLDPNASVATRSASYK